VSLRVVSPYRAFPPAAIPAILGHMAKVMVSLPDELLERIDTRARARHSTRSGFLRDLAERELASDTQRTKTEIEALLGEPVPLGGNATRLIRQDRRSH
jgi:hypothetical protein